MSTGNLPAKPQQNELMKRPDFLAEEKKLGIEGIGEYIRPPMFKTIQPQSKGEFAEKFNKGDVILLPNMEVCFPVLLNEGGKSTEKGSVFHFIPIFFFTEYCVWNPIEINAESAIRERTFDKNSVIAKKARNKETWFETCPEDNRYKIRYCEHLNFFLIPTTPSIAEGQLVVQSFARGRYRDGAKLLQEIRTRDASIFGMQFEANTRFRKNAKGEWYGWDIRNPSVESGVDGWIRDRVMFKKYEELHLQCQSAYDKELIKPEYEIEDTAPAADSDEM